MIFINDITRLVVFGLGIILFIRTIALFRQSKPKKLMVAIFPLMFSGQIILFFVLQRSGQVDPLVLNWVSQLIRVQVIIFFLAILQWIWRIY